MLKQNLTPDSSFTFETIGDGNCLFNAVALGLRELIKSDNNILYQKWFSLFQSYFPNLKKQSTLVQFDDLLRLNLKEYQQKFSPSLRQITVAYLRKNYYALFSETIIARIQLLFHSYHHLSEEEKSQYCDDDCFILHKSIHEQLNKSSATEESFKSWWTLKGWSNYLTAMEKPANDVNDKSHWGGELELTALALAFEINIEWQRNAASNIVGILGGVISKEQLTSNEIKQLAILGLGDIFGDNVRLTIDALEKSKKLEPLPEKWRHSIENCVVSGARIFPNSLQELSANEYQHCQKKLAEREIIIKYKDQWIFIQEDQNSTAVERIWIRFNGLSSRLKQKINHYYQKNVPLFSVGYTENHWYYKTSPDNLNVSRDKLEDNKKQISVTTIDKMQGGVIFYSSDNTVNYQVKESTGSILAPLSKENEQAVAHKVIEEIISHRNSKLSESINNMVTKINKDTAHSSVFIDMSQSIRIGSDCPSSLKQLAEKYSINKKGQTFCHLLKKSYKPRTSIRMLYDGNFHSVDDLFIPLALTSKKDKKANTSNLKVDSSLYKYKVKKRNIIALKKLFEPSKLAKKNNKKPTSIRQILIKGHSGSGKSTLCMQVASHFCQETEQKLFNRFDVLFWIPLRQLVHEERLQIKTRDYSLATLVKYICFDEGMLKWTDEEQLMQWIEQEKNSTLWLLDGWDEIVPIKQYLPWHLESLINQILQCPYVILTTRPNVEIPFKPDREIYSRGFTSYELENYIRQFFENLPSPHSKKSRQLIDFINKHTQIKDLGKTPINAELLCCLWENEKNTLNQSAHDKPITKTELYTILIEHLLRRELTYQEEKNCQKKNRGKTLRLCVLKNEKNQIIDYDKEDWSANNVFSVCDPLLKCIRLLAFYIQHQREQNGQIWLNNHVFERVLYECESNEAAQILLKKSIRRFGLLSTSKGDIMFTHLSFQEYFAGEYVAHHLSQPKQMMPIPCGNTSSFNHWFSAKKYLPIYAAILEFTVGHLCRRSSSTGLHAFFYYWLRPPRDAFRFYETPLLVCFLNASEDKLNKDIDEQLIDYVFDVWMQVLISYSPRGYKPVDHKKIKKFKNDFYQAINCNPRLLSHPQWIHRLKSSLEDQTITLQKRQKQLKALKLMSNIPSVIIEILTDELQANKKDVRISIIKVLKKQTLTHQNPLSNYILHKLIDTFSYDSVDNQTKECVKNILKYHCPLSNALLHKLIDTFSYNNVDNKAKSYIKDVLRCHHQLSNAFLQQLLVRLVDNKENDDTKKLIISLFRHQAELPNPVQQEIFDRLLDDKLDDAIKEKIIYIVDDTFFDIIDGSISELYKYTLPDNIIQKAVNILIESKDNKNKWWIMRLLKITHWSSSTVIDALVQGKDKAAWKLVGIVVCRILSCELNFLQTFLGRAIQALVDMLKKNKAPNTSNWLSLLLQINLLDICYKSQSTVLMDDVYLIRYHRSDEEFRQIATDCYSEVGNINIAKKHTLEEILTMLKLHMLISQLIEIMHCEIKLNSTEDLVRSYFIIQDLDIYYSKSYLAVKVMSEEINTDEIEISELINLPFLQNHIHFTNEVLYNSTKVIALGKKTLCIYPEPKSTLKLHSKQKHILQKAFKYKREQLNFPDSNGSQNKKILDHLKRTFPLHSNSPIKNKKILRIFKKKEGKELASSRKSFGL